MSAEVIRFNIEAAERSLARHLNAAVMALGPSALGLIDLPPLGSGSVEPAQIRVAAVLLWAREVEAAGLPSFVEAVAEQLATGRLALQLRAGGTLLMRYYRSRHERFSADERQALYTRLFGTDESDDVARGLDVLVQNLCAIGAAPAQENLLELQSRLSVGALALAEPLSERAVGIAAFAARDIVANVRQALALLGDPEIAWALGGGDPWSIVRVQSQLVLGRPIDPAPHRARAAAGHTLLEWLADAATGLEAGNVTVGRNDPVVRAAQTWQAEGPA